MLTKAREYLGLNRNVTVLAASIFGLGLGEEMWQSFLPLYLAALGANSRMLERIRETDQVPDVRTDCHVIRGCTIIVSENTAMPNSSPKAAAISKIRALANECGQEGWDGNGAVPISEAAAVQAVEFVHALPDGIPLPDFAPDPDGSISLDWIRSRSRLFSLSVGTNGRLAYAWLDGADRGHAVAVFDGETVPWRILEEIKGIMDDANAPVRTVLGG